MGPFVNTVDKLIDNRAITEQTLNKTIGAMHRLDQDLTHLTTTIDKESWAACQHGGSIDVKSLAASMSTTIFDKFEHSSLDPTQEQLDWLRGKLHQVNKVLHTRGEKHITDLNKERHSNSLQVEGGTGYTQKFLGHEWSLYRRDLSLHPIPELQDRVAYPGGTTQTLMDVQRVMAQGMDETNKELS